ncbi:hypothetical protein [Cochleicola gelatinilyticus]|uniref:hypothetical protein n=1 Tax=Cochleicola gelatinilyticus TaxID=1763537 RepID=UPI0012FA54E4|nr:hypothetical protein [Cochleicola gelatinilyticus]
MFEIPANKQVYVNSYFSNLSTDYVYKAKIEAFSNSFGGILIIKKIDTNQHRIVFTTEFGNKIFDFELLDDEVKIHFIMDQLDKEIVINTLINDFRVLTHENNSVDKAFENTVENIYRTPLKKRFNFYFENKDTQKLNQIRNTTATKEKTIIQFKKIEEAISKEISITHNGFPLSVNLFFLDQ